MIHHLLTILWNERRNNALLLLEFILVFVILWFCTDFLWYMGSRALEPKGYDIRHTYNVAIGKKPEAAIVETDNQLPSEEIAAMIADRLSRYPGVESVGLSEAGQPFGGSTVTSNFVTLPDSVKVSGRTRKVNLGYFSVFKVKTSPGALDGWNDYTDSNAAVILSPDSKGKYGDYPVSEIRSLIVNMDNDRQALVIGTANKIKSSDYLNYEPNMFFPLPNKDFRLERVQFSIRVSPDADGRDFAARFVRDMQDQLDIGYCYLHSVTPISERRTAWLTSSGETSQLKSTYALTFFVVINIFLGVIGTFWFRTQARRGEIGLRIAMGASRRRVKRLFTGETLLMLFIASIVATAVCLNVGVAGVMENFGLPYIDRKEAGVVGWQQDTIDYMVSFAVLALIALAAVWYPAAQAARTQPAEALHEE